MITQKITSAGTCVKKLPAALPAFDRWLSRYGGRGQHWDSIRDVLDFGGGKYDLLGDQLAKRGVRTLVLDPFNRPAAHNELVTRLLSQAPADMAFCNCVLNVVREPAARRDLLQKISDLVEENALVVFSVYEGDKTGRGKRTSKGWQNNRRLRSYLPEIEDVFDIEDCTTSIIIAVRR